MAVGINIDIEATNRCNAVCHFSLRDTTPHQGHMSMETFDLVRAVNAGDSPQQKLDRMVGVFTLESEIAITRQA